MVVPRLNDGLLGPREIHINNNSMIELLLAWLERDKYKWLFQD